MLRNERLRGLEAEHATRPTAGARPSRTAAIPEVVLFMLTDADKARLKRMAERAVQDEERRRRARTERIRSRVAAAWDEVNDLVEQFRAEDIELSRVVLFGSLARDEVLREDFDIDLAVESDRYFELLGIALRSRFHVDLIDLNTAAPHIRDAVNREGVEVYRADR